MKIKKILAALMSAAMLTTVYVNVLAAEEISGSTDFDTHTYTWSISERSALSAATVLTGTSDYIDFTLGMGKGDSIGTSNRIDYANPSVKETTTSGYSCVGDTGRYMLFEPKADGTLNVSLVYANATTSTKFRIYYAEYDSVTSDTINALAKGGSTLMEVSDKSKHSAELNMSAGKKYVLYTYNTSGQIRLSYTSDAIVEETAANVSDITIKTFSGGEYEGEATAAMFTVTPGSSALQSISVTYDGTTLTKDDTTLTGEGSYVCGIIVPAIAEADDFTIEVE